jgi:hypothetical protein
MGRRNHVFSCSQPPLCFQKICHQMVDLIRSDASACNDKWAAKQDPPETRPEAIRGLLELVLKAKSAK